MRKPLWGRGGALLTAVILLVGLSWFCILDSDKTKTGELMPPKPGTPDYRYLKPAIEVFGEKRGEPIYSGFIFKDGVYLKAPYVVSRRGVEIFLNNFRVRSYLGLEWPPLDWEWEDKIPEIPKEFTKTTSIKELEANGWDGVMLRWVQRHYDKKKAKELVAEYYKKLPFIKTIERKGELLLLTTWSGGTMKLDLDEEFGFQVYRPPTPEQTWQVIEGFRKYWEKRLRNGESFFLSHDSVLFSVGTKETATNLATIVGILQSNSSKDQKMKELNKYTHFPQDASVWDIWFNKFSASPQLKKRIKQLQSPSRGRRNWLDSQVVP